MIIATTVSSVIFGLVLGLIYGRSFAHTQRSVLFTQNSSHAMRIRLKTFAYFILRIIAMVVIWQFVLQSPRFNPILVLLVFVVSFWLTLLSNKAHWYEGT